MRFSSQLFGLATLAMLGLTNASPTTNSITSLECLAVEVIIDVLYAYPPASSFCSSFLNIPTITRTTTAKRSVTKTSTITTTTGTKTITADTVTVTETAYASITTCIPSNIEKRGGGSKSVPSPLTPFPSDQISTACSCLAIPTPSTTVTALITVTSKATSYVDAYALATTTPTTTITVTSTSTDIACPAPTECGNEGFQWAEYTNDQGNNTDLTYSQFDPTVYKDEVPNQYGVTVAAGGLVASEDDLITVYNSTEFYGNHFILDHRGYIYAEISGTYTLQVSSVDDNIFVWAGANAYSGWTRDNADLTVSILSSQTGTLSVNLTEGEYLPIRVMYVQAQGRASFDISITAPDGTDFLDTDTTGSLYLIQYSCDGTSAPAFPAWGSEI